MATKVVDANSPSTPEGTEKPLVKIYKPMPLLPREEALRLRRATRNAADSLAPWALQKMAELVENTVDDEIRLKALKEILAISISKKSTEELDPDGPVVDASAVSDALAALEKETEKTGSGGGEG